MTLTASLDYSTLRRSTRKCDLTVNHDWHAMYNNQVILNGPYVTMLSTLNSTLEVPNAVCYLICLDVN